MARKKFYVCDNCGKIIKRKKNCYHLVLRTDWFDTHNPADGPGKDRKEIRLDLCYSCARNIVKTLENIKKILEKLDEPGGVYGPPPEVRKIFGEGLKEIEKRKNNG